MLIRPDILPHDLPGEAVVARAKAPVQIPCIGPLVENNQGHLAEK